MTTDGTWIAGITEQLSDIKITDIEILGAIDVSLQSPTPVTVVNDIGLSVLQFTPAKASESTDDKYNSTPSQSALLSETAIYSTPINNQNLCCNDATCSVCLSPLLCRAALIETRCKV